MANEFDEIEFTPGTSLHDDEPEEREEPEQVDEEPTEEPGEVDNDETIDDEPEEEPEEEKREVPTRYEDAEAEKEKAAANGWTPFEEWVKQGNPPGEWKTAKHFNEVGELYNNQRRQSKDHQRELENTRLLMEARIRDVQSRAQQIEQQMKEAVESGDWDQVQTLNKQQQQNKADELIMQNQLHQTQTNSQQEIQQKEIEWEKTQPWFNVHNPADPNYSKSMFVAQTYQQNLQQGMDFDAAINAAVSQADVKFKTSNPNRERKSITDDKSPGRKNGKAKTFDELPADALREWEKYGQDMFGSKKEFAKAWNNLQKG